MTDLPTDVAELHARLKAAREHYGGLLRRLVGLEASLLEASNVIAAATQVCDGEARGVHPEHELIDKVRLLVAVDSGLVSANMRRHNLLAEVVDLWTESDMRPDGREWQALLDRLTREVTDAPSRTGPAPPF